MRKEHNKRKENYNVLNIRKEHNKRKKRNNFLNIRKEHNNVEVLKSEYKKIT